MHDFNSLKISRSVIASTAFQYAGRYDFTENPWSWFWLKTGLMSIDDFGAVITSTITVKERKGFYINRFRPDKVIRIYPTKIYNRFGWNNCGIEKFVKIELPKLGDKIKKIIVSIGALESIEEFFIMLRILNELDVVGIEMNISCHNVNLCFLKDSEILRVLFKEARKISRHPLIVKINAESDYVLISKIAQEERINAVHVMNAMRVYSEVLGGYCGRSGKENKKVALRIIRELRQNGITIPIIGGSWIWTLEDIKDYEDSGANIFSISSLFIYLPFYPGFLSKKVK